MRTPPWPELIELAGVHGVATNYYDWHGNRTEVSAETLVRVLAGFDVEAGSPAACRRALRRRAATRPILPPCIAVHQALGDGRRAEFDRELHRFTVHAPDRASAATAELWVELADGGRRRDVARVDDVAPDGSFTCLLPPRLPIGWHELRARVGGRTVVTPLAIAPDRLAPPKGIATRRAWGFGVQLHSVRSRRSWAFGDLADLAELGRLAGYELGAGFLVVNPLHAGSPVPPIDPSPYLPASRRFHDPVHLAVEAVPEYAVASPRLRAAIDELAEPLRKASIAGEPVDREGSWLAKRAALRQLFDAVPRTPGRAAAYRAFVAREGKALRTHALWCVLVERYGQASATWPPHLRTPDAPGIPEFVAEHAAEIDFHRWLQWLLDEQLDSARRAATEAGMALGVVHDLAVGSQPDGSDAWADRDVYASAIASGAPPDEFNQLGQDWGQRPWRPDRLAESGYAAYRAMLRAVLRHADGLRIDHVMGLFRLWWVPNGASAAEGTYVTYDHEAMIAILMLEAHLAGALVIGEDLGTVEPWVRSVLAERGVYGTSILWFERDSDGSPLPLETWRQQCVAALTTHDLPPTAAKLDGSYIDVRERLGLLARPVEEERADEKASTQAWLDVLRRAGLLRAGAGEQETIEAFYRYLARTPCRLVGVWLPDAVGDRTSHNLPGTSGDTYPNWRLPVTDANGRPVLLDDFAAHPRVRSLARALSVL